MSTVTLFAEFWEGPVECPFVRDLGGGRAVVQYTGLYIMAKLRDDGQWEPDVAVNEAERAILHGLTAGMGTTTTVTAPDGSPTTYEDP